MIDFSKKIGGAIPLLFFLVLVLSTSVSALTVRGVNIEAPSTVNTIVYNGTNQFINNTYYTNTTTYINTTAYQNTSEVDPIFTAANSSLARIGDCPAGQVVQNTTLNGVQCVPMTAATGNFLNLSGTNADQNINIGSWNFTASNLFGFINWSWIVNAPTFLTTWLLPDTTNGYLYNDSTKFYFNDTLLNNTIDARASAFSGNASFNQTLTDGLYYSISNPNNYINATTGQIFNDTDYITAVNLSLTNSKAGIGNCPTGQFVVNTTTGGVECASPPSVDFTNVAFTNRSEDWGSNNITASNFFGWLNWSWIQNAPNFITSLNDVWNAIAGNRTEIETNTNNAINGNISVVNTNIQANWSDLELRKLNASDQRYNETDYINNNFYNMNTSNYTYIKTNNPSAYNTYIWPSSTPQEATVLTYNASGDNVYWKQPQLSGVLQFWMWNNASDIANTKAMYDYSGGTTNTISVTTSGNNNNIELGNWSTQPNFPSQIIILEGTWEVAIFANATDTGGQRQFHVYADIYKVNATGGDKLKLGTTAVSPIVQSGTALEYSTQTDIGQVSLNITDRIFVSLRYNTNEILPGGSSTMKIFYEGSTHTHLKVPVSSVIANSFVPYTGANKNVNLDGFNLTAQNIFSTNICYANGTNCNTTALNLNNTYMFRNGTNAANLVDFKNSNVSTTGRINVSRAISNNAAFADYGSIAFGPGSFAQGYTYGAAAFGEGASASGEGAFSAGELTQSNAEASISLGLSAIANSLASVSIGRSTVANQNFAIAMGDSYTNNIASSFTVGYGAIDLSVRSQNTTVFGNLTVTKCLRVNSTIICDFNQVPTYNATYAQWAYNQTIPANDYTNSVIAANNASWLSTYNETYNTWAYNQTTAAINYLNSTYGMFWYNQSANLSGYVPYTGATSNVNLDGFNLTTSKLNATSYVITPKIYLGNDGTYMSANSTSFSLYHGQTEVMLIDYNAINVTFTSPGAFNFISDQPTTFSAITVTDYYLAKDNRMFRFGNGDVGGYDTFIVYNGTDWKFDIFQNTSAIKFNPSQFDTDFIVYGDTGEMINADAGTLGTTFGGNINATQNLSVAKCLAINGTYKCDWNQVSTYNATYDAKAGTGNCPAGSVVVNTTTTGVQCIPISALQNVTNYWNLTGNNLYPANLANNVGIGTTNPVNKLSISQTATNNAAAVSITDGTGSFYIYPQGDTDWNLIQTAGRNGLKINTDNTVTSNFFVIESSGNVGIGTESPIATLHVNSTDTTNYGILSEVPAGYGALRVKRNGGSEIAIYPDSSDGMNFWVAGGNRLMISGSTGNVGIGATNPEYNLVINRTSDGSLGSGNVVAQLYGNKHAFLKLTANSTGTPVNWGVYSAGDTNRLGIYSYSASTDIMSILSNGNVGINTIVPAAKLDVVQSSDGGDNDGIRVDAASGRALYMSWVNGGNDFQIKPSAGSLIIPQGNVGIGTNNTEEGKLTVEVNDAGTTFFDANTLVLRNINLGANTSSGIWFGANLSMTPTATIRAVYESPIINGDTSLHFSVSEGTTTFDSLILYKNGDIKVNAGDLIASQGLFIGQLGGATADHLCRDGNTGEVTSCSSSQKYKENIVNSTINATDYMNKLRPIDFKWIGRNENGLGLLAEDVEGIDNRLVTYYNGSLEGVRYDSISVINTMKIKELMEENAQLRSAICELNATLSICN